MAGAEKSGLRAALLDARRERPAADLLAARIAVRRHVLSRVAAAGWRSVAAYDPLRTEPGSLSLLAALAIMRMQVLVPLTLPDRDLDWVPWQRFGVGAPLGRAAIASVDAVFVPALAVARDGTRLGRGGGSYDRALPRRSPTATVAALLFADEVVETLPRESWDVPVTAVVTPGGWCALPAGNTGLASDR